MTEVERLNHLESRIEEHRFLFRGLILFLKEHGETKASFLKRMEENPRLIADRRRPEEGDQAQDEIIWNMPNDLLDLLDS